jgi:hypothetical protein
VHNQLKLELLRVNRKIRVITTKNREMRVVRIIRRVVTELSDRVREGGD